MEGSLLLVSKAAKPWQGRTLKGSGRSGTRFWTSSILRGKVVTAHFVTFGLEGREIGGGARFWTPAVLWKGRHFWSPGARNRGGKGVLYKTLAVAARALGPLWFCVEGPSLLVWRGSVGRRCFWTSAGFA